MAVDKTVILEAIDAEIRTLQGVKALLQGKPSPGKRGAKLSPAPGKRKFSAEARAKIAAGQKARWAKVKKTTK